jgi:alanyl-tRNA synthetase
LRTISDHLLADFPKRVLLLSKVEKDKISVLLRVHKDNQSGVSCSNILKDSIGILMGRGGGKPDIAQGSGDAPQKWPEFVKDVVERIKARP